MARKNRILAPTKVVHFYGVSRDSREQDIEVGHPRVLECNQKDCQDLFAEYCAPVPAKVKFVESKKEREGSGAEDRSGVGLAYFNTVEVRRLKRVIISDVRQRL